MGEKLARREGESKMNEEMQTLRRGQSGTEQVLRKLWRAFGLAADNQLTRSKNEMLTAEQAKRLHEKASRGENLTSQERAQLEEWYAALDAAEIQELGLNAVEKTLATLQEQIDAALTQLMTVTKRIQEVASENEVLRREIATLRHQVASLLAPQSA